MNPVSALTATVQSDIGQASELIERVISGYVLQIYNTGDSLWITAQWPDRGRIAFRAAYAFGDAFDIIKLEEAPGIVSLFLETRLGKYHVRLRIPKSNEAVFRYTTTFKPFQPLIIPYCPRDIVPLTKNSLVENTAGKVHLQQVGARSGQLFFSMTRPRTGSVFYFQNLTALSEYCEATETTAAETVGGTWPDIGFRFHTTEDKAFPPKELVVSDAFVFLSDVIPTDDFEVSKQYLNALASIYVQLPKPEPKYQDLVKIAEESLQSITLHKGCWTYAGGHSYLNAYLGDYKTPAEIMVQLAVLLPLKEYLSWKGEENFIVSQIEKGLPAFYDERIKTVSRWLPAMVDHLDKSEEQKKEMVMDSWYLHHPLMNLARLAKMDDQSARELVVKSVDYAIKTAHHFNYEWPVFYKMDTLEIEKRETEPGKGGEKDVPGSYAHLMLNMWELTGEKRYFNEAVKAAKHLNGLGLDIFYQANNTAFSAGALLDLYKETKEELYLNMSYNCIASIFKNVQLWDANYGNAKSYSKFFAVYPLNDAPYTAAYEEFEVYTALDYYLKAADGVAILPSVRLLIAEMQKYFLSRLPYYYPPMLPKDILSDEVKTGEIDPEVWVPLEDLYDGWEKAGQVGQEVYGAGAGFGVLPRQYFRIPGGGLVFANYPVVFITGRNSVEINLQGNQKLRANVRIISDDKPALTKFKLKDAHGPIIPVDESDRYLEFMVSGNASLTLSWN